MIKAISRKSYDTISASSIPSFHMIAKASEITRDCCRSLAVRFHGLPSRQFFLLPSASFTQNVGNYRGQLIDIAYDQTTLVAFQQSGAAQITKFPGYGL